MALKDDDNGIVSTEPKRRGRSSNSDLTCLLSCPCCGSDAVCYYPEGDGQAQAIYCRFCPMGAEDNTITKQDLFAAWNRRAT